jgi:Rrf2 family protein
MTIYSKPSKIAVRILSHLASKESGTVHAVRIVAKETGVSEPTVAKTLQTLAKVGLLKSRKGPGGGFILAALPGDVSLARIVSAFEGDNFFPDCIGGLEECSDLAPCPLHDKWKSMKNSLVEFLEDTSLKELVSVMRRREKLLKNS